MSHVPLFGLLARRFFPARLGRRPFQRRPTAPPRLEALEERRAPATRVWDGGGVTVNWSDRFNWAGDVAPVNNDDLVFPDRTTLINPASRDNVNNIAGLSVNSIRF